jgi:eukaryotic-like serine/threonine-protein kinase
MEKGTAISHYNIVEKLGEGGMGVVYKALDTKLNRTVALKFLPEYVGVTEEEKTRFINEAQSASALDHPNICTIHAIEETDDGRLFIVMAYYDGKPLNKVIEERPLPFPILVNYALQIASGLGKAHDKEITHRDLKPANILVTGEDKIKIIDFGLAKAAGQAMLTKTGTTLGTYPYMSPEQAQGERADYRSDIWSLGVLIYEMVTGQRPFKSEYESALVYSILNEDPEPVTALRSGVPMELERIINKCLEKSPGNRYQRVDDLLVDLRRVLNELSESSTTSGSAKKVMVETSDGKENTSARISATKILAISSVVVLFVIAGIFYFSSSRPDVLDLTRSIAVLPLENLSLDPDDAYFAAGIHEDIIIQLSQIGSMQVIARSSVMNYQPGQRNIQNISNDLGVQSILEGSVRRAADRVRVSVTLTDALTNRTLWANTFDRDLTDIFTIQSEIAMEIARALEARLTTSEEQQMALQPTENAHAYELYLRARDYYNQPGAQENNFRMAESLLIRSNEHDTAFANAYALLSRVYTSLYWFNHERSREVLEKARMNAEKALELQPKLADSYMAFGYYHYQGHRNYSEALKYFNTALEFQPNNADIISSIGFVERRLGNFEESIAMVDRAISLDPRNLNLIFNNAQSKMLTRRHEAAEQDYLRVLEFAPNLPVIKVLITLNRILWKADIDAVKRFFADNPELREVVTGDWMRLQMLIGDYEGMLQTLEEVPKEIYEGQLFLYTTSLLRAIAIDISGDRSGAQAHYLNALNEYLNMGEDYSNDPRYRMALGRIYSGLSKADEAVYHGKAAVKIIEEMVDALEAPTYIHELATIYAAVGQADEAVALIRELLSQPGYMTYARLGIEPAWNPIRNTPQFHALLNEAN